MWALVTGASSGIGRDMARYLFGLGYNLIITARNIDELNKLKNELLKHENELNEEKFFENDFSKNKVLRSDFSKNKKELQEINALKNEEKSAKIEKSNEVTKSRKIIVIKEDLSKKENCIDLYEKTKQIDLDLLVNNAGFGVFGNFTETDLEKEINLINTNITAVHILTKLYLKDMCKKNKGIILNVASIAGMEPGPLMSAYYASKAYVIRLSRAVNKELKKQKSNVKISILCPGPVDTNFNNVANVKFKAPSAPSETVAKYGIDKALKGKLIIIPGFLNKTVRLFSKIMPDCVLESVAYHIQERKRNGKEKEKIFKAKT